MGAVVLNHFEQTVRPFMDFVDQLRGLGVDQDVPLPTIAVIGDQSSGKSSVLEALSGVQLPRGTGVVTRCPLELILIHSEDTDWEGKISYRHESIKLDSPEQVCEEIKNAQNQLAGKNCEISNERITVQIKSKTTPDLTLIDLPGITRVAVGGQPDDIASQIKSLIYEYIMNKETINLVVIPCTADITTAEALQMAQEVDPEGERTIGVLTKPDLVDKGMEERILSIIRNELIPLKRGYAIVRCRGQKEIDDKVSLSDALNLEKRFFKGHQNFRNLLDSKQADINNLAEKLSRELLTLIKSSLNTIEADIFMKLQKVEEELSLMGNIPTGSREIARFLTEKIKDFLDDIQALTNGDISKQLVKEAKLYCFTRDQFSKWHQTLEQRDVDSEYILSFSDDLGKRVESTLLPLAEEFIQISRGRQLPGFQNYSLFEALCQRLIKEMEPHTFQLLSAISDKVLEALNEVATMHFKTLPNLLKHTKEKSSQIQQAQKAHSAELIKTLFKMEEMVYTQDGTYSYKMDELQAQDDDNARGKGRRRNELSDLMKHVKTYLKISSGRLADMVPMILRFHMLLETGAKLQTEILLVLQDTEGLEHMAEEKEDTAEHRRRLVERQDRLKRAKEQLLKF
ncbi:interferon-induced GTP-binding protein Mx-like [Megalops cyprinoides]|uniref:interferon-induced GTP-binding protein Mx-like n=1 Tax=Megalops cyprinoides TaxID=118141 RepID=UPI00186498B0|nr:interferon-induced GTP-binding protein Mx-like [Megalops cyprinoides]